MKKTIDEILTHKTFVQSVKAFLFGAWLVSGLAGIYTIPGTTLQLQWAYGTLFGIGLIHGADIIATKGFWLLYKNISAFRNHVDEHWGNPE